MFQKNKFQKGMALLLTLSIMSLLMLVVTRTFEKSSVELKLEENSRQSFKIKRLGISTLRAITASLLEVGAGNLYYINYQLPDIGVPLYIFGENSTAGITGLRINSLDHLFFINRINFNFQNDTVSGQIHLFNNVLQQFPKADNTEFNPAVINNFIGELADFIDSDSEVTHQNFLTGQESYPNAQPAYYVKNAKLDLLSEILLLPSFQTMNILQDDQSVFDLPLRVITHNDPSKQCDIGPLDLNMLPPDKQKAKEIILKYINWTEGITLPQCGYALMYENRFRLAENIASYVDERKLPPYSSPLSGDQAWSQQVNSLGEQHAKTKLDGLFTSKSGLVEVKFTLVDGPISSRYRVHLLLTYANETTTNPIAIKVLYFSHHSFNL